MQTGDTVEDFTLPDQDGHLVTLSQFRGKPVVLFFYPKADTPGCTVEACEFRDAFPKFSKLGSEAVVLGISRDTAKAQAKFKAKHDLPYMLLADTDQVIVNRFGLVKPKMMYGKQVTGVERTTYLIDAEGKLARKWEKVKPEGHAEEVLAALKELDRH
jgi:thioredoxin-dependent peroxiredoxin